MTIIDALLGPGLTGVATAPSSPTHPSVFAETYGYLIALAVMIAALVAIGVLRSRRQGRAYLELLSSHLRESEVLLRAADAERLATCWHCGAPDAERRPVRLSRVIFVGVGVGGEEVTPSIPLCRKHGDPNIVPHWVRVLSIPLGGLAFAITMAVWPFHGRVLGCVWLATSLAVGVVVGWFLRRWANRRESFRLVFLDTHDNIMIVRFRDAARAAVVRHEVGDILGPPSAKNGATAVTKGMTDPG